MEYVQGQSLRELYNRCNRHISHDLCRKLAYQIFDAMAYLHEHKIAHRDIKLENILVTNNNIIKIIDFGFGVYEGDNSLQSFFCGTPNYMPPEIAYKVNYHATLSDLWSLGILLYKMIVGEFPFKAKDEKDLYKLIKKCNFEIPSNIPSEAAKIIKGLITVRPSERMSARAVVSSPWFNEEKV